MKTREVFMWHGRPAHGFFFRGRRHGRVARATRDVERASVV